MGSGQCVLRQTIEKVLETLSDQGPPGPGLRMIDGRPQHAGKNRILYRGVFVETKMRAGFAEGYRQLLWRGSGSNRR